MPIPLIVPLGLAAVAAYALFSRSGSSAQAPGGGSYPSYPSAPSAGPTPAPAPAPTPASPGNSIPGGNWDPGNATPTFPDPTPSPADTPLGPAVDSTGVKADPSILSSLENLFSSSGPTDLVWSDHPHVLAATRGRGGWVPRYPGYEEGYAPPGGWPIH